MSEALFSPHWYRVEKLQPQLRSHIEVHRHEYRGMIWYILEDKASSRNHRFNSTAYQIIGLLDGQSSINHIWDRVNDRLGDYAPTQDQVIQLLGKLHAADLLDSGLPADTEELFQRSKRHSAAKIKKQISSPLSIRVPLWDPDDFLGRHASKVSWMLKGYIGLIWFLVVLGASGALAMHWQAVSTNMLANSLTPYNLIIMVLLYPLVKLLHEFGHAFTAKIQGAEVHEMGVVFLVFMPIPYVDVSTVNSLRSKYQRMLVSSAGILIELFLASVALLFWLSVQPGLVKDIAFNIVLLGGISSLFFNGNPLLKYDGYYILVDAVGIPNLFQRSTKFLSYLCQKYLFAINGQSSPASAPGEAAWFIFYSISSSIYRIGLLWVIALYVIDTFFIVGVLLAAWMIIMQILMPILKGLKFIFTSPNIQRKRFRAVSITGILLAGVISFTLLVPMPAYTHSQGVVWLPEDTQLRAEKEGFVRQLLVPTNTQIKEGTAIMEIHDPLLDTKVEVLMAKLKELNTQFRAEWSVDRVKADNLKEQMQVLVAELKQAKKNQQAMRVKSKKTGKLLIPLAEDLEGRFVQQGELLGYVIDDALPTVRVVVTQDDIGQLNKQVQEVQLRLVNDIDRVFAAKIIRRAPEATHQLPSAALASTNGGNIAIDPGQTDNLTTSQKVFHIDLQFSPTQSRQFIGQRVYVRFDHGSEPFAYQGFRRVQQVFLRQFNV